MKVAVLVLGDLGRSPRMQYHAVSLANEEHISQVYLIGYQGTPCISAVRRNPKIYQILISKPITSNISRHLFLLYTPIRILQQILQLSYTLLIELSTCDYILIQNPPCIPTFLFAGLLKSLKGTRVVIDWHNLAYTLMDSKFGTQQSIIEKALVKIAKFHELNVSIVGDYHICVTEEFKKYLLENAYLAYRNVFVLYDRPNELFEPLSVSKRHRLFYKLADTLFNQGFDKKITDSIDIMETPFTLVEKTDESDIAKVSLKKVIKERPFLFVSSTSYTPDEDISILLEAFKLLDKKLEKHGWEVKPFPDVLCVITGKGDLKDYYGKKMRDMNLSHVTMIQAWLESEDYPALLSSADVGISLHTSSSGIDLPMKIVDMFGAGIPVLAADYVSISELVKHKVNGLIFKSPKELAEQMWMILGEYELPKEERLLTKLKQGAYKEKEYTWKSEWKTKTKNIFVPYSAKPTYQSLFIMLISLLLPLAASLWLYTHMS